ncbi:MAG: DUF2950 family protein [Planctomycetes bacterium]|nr:DUF2950 family protein [Planctomycetota bacterium]
MWRKEGFTLIELMIVVAIIAIIAAIAIPNLITGKIAANEASALAGLKMLTAQEAVWRQQDADGNGIKDYWTYDVSCFNRMYRANGTTKVGFIDIAFARADASPVTDTGIPRVIASTPTIEAWFLVNDSIQDADAGTLTSKSGYWFRALRLTNLTATQAQLRVNDIDNTNTINLGAHTTLFAFAAMPEAYGTSGVNIFCVDNGGTVYSTDPGTPSAGTGWSPFLTTVPVATWNLSTTTPTVIGGTPAGPLTWPVMAAGGAPTVVYGPGNRRWAPAE